MFDISLILPTRERPALAVQTLKSLASTTNRPEQLEVVLYVDSDDVPSHAIDHADLHVVKLIRPRARMGAITQACYAACTGRYIMLLNDDVVCRTTGWDSEVLAAFENHADDVALVWGDDLMRGSQLPCFPVLSRTVCEILGNICPDRYHRDYIDVHIYDVFDKLRQLGHDRFLYLPKTIFEHMHVEAGKAIFDSTSVKNRKTDDELTFLAWEEERKRAAVRLARHIQQAKKMPISARAA